MKAFIIGRFQPFHNGHLAIIKYRIRGDIENTLITNREDLEKFFRENNGEYAIKPIGLTGGKGVKVMILIA